MELAYLTFDLGTSGVKAILFSDSGVIIDKEFVSYKTYYPSPGYAEQIPDEWYSSICIATQVLAQRTGCKNSILAISFSGQTMGCVCVNKAGHALRNALIHCDQRATKEALFLSAVIGEKRLYTLTGTKLSPSYPLEKLMWIKNNELDVYNHTYKIIGPKDYIVARICGRIATEFTEASMSGCFLLKDHAWSEEILEAAQIDIDKFPDILDPTSIAGNLSRESAENMGLPHGIPIVMGGADGQCGCLGIAGDDTVHSYGYLGSAAVAYTSSPKLTTIGDPSLVTINCNAIKGLYRYYSTMQTAGISFSWLRSLLSSDETAPLSFEKMSACAENGKGVSSGLFFLPYLLGERSPYWNPHARGAFIGITPSHTSDDFICAVMEGVAMNFAINYKEIMKTAPKNDIILYGGCANSKRWQQIFSNVLNTPVYVSDMCEEAASFGAMLLAKAALNSRNDFYPVPNHRLVATPLPDLVRMYAQASLVFQRLYSSLFNSFEDIVNYMETITTQC